MSCRPIVMALALVLAAACGGDDAPGEGGPCEGSDECTDGLVCVLGACREECTGYRECPIGSACLEDASGVAGCRLRGEAECGACPTGTECVDDACVTRCTSSETCGGTECVAGTCEDPATTRIYCEDLVYCGAGICDFDVCDDELVIAPGEIVTCALRVSGEVDCAGSDEDGLLGDGPTEPDDESGVRGLLLPVALDEPAMALGVGARHACVVLDSGEVRCWGRGDRGQTGAAGTVDLPVTAIDAPEDESDAIDELAVGAHHACVRRASGAIECWGSDEAGQLGDAATHPACEGGVACSAAPVAVAGLSDVLSDVIALDAGEDATCALRADGRVACWGGGESATPVVLDAIAGATAIAVGGAHGCAIVQDGIVECWGARSGEVVLPMAATVIDAGGARTCALLTDDRVWCWAESGAPRAVSGLPRAFAVAIGREHGCAQTFDGETWCWGRNAEAQLAQGAPSETAGPGRARRSPPGGA